MDSFFASVEQRDNPELRGKPIAVGGTSNRGVISTASYEARVFGVHSAMSTKKALELCPDLILLKSNFSKYKEVSEHIHRIFHEYTDIVEPISLDEAFLDVTHNKKDIELATVIAKEIKQKIQEQLNLTASAGISYCKFLAKIASDYNKPDGFFLIHPDKAQAFINNLKIEKFWGVGSVTAKRMHQLGIFTGSQLRQWSLEGLTKEFGKSGMIYYNFARGIDTRPVVASRIRKSVGCETTFEVDLYKKANVIIELYHIVEELVRRLEKDNFEGHTLTLKIKYHNFNQITRSQTKTVIYKDKTEILNTSKELLNEVEFGRKKTIRLIGLSVSNPLREHKPEWTEQNIWNSDDF